MNKVFIILISIMIQTVLIASPTISNIQCEQIKKNYEAHYPAWNILSDQEKKELINDEIIFCTIELLLKDEVLSDQEKLEQFITLFEQFYNKEHRKQAGTVLAPIVSFTHDTLQAELISFVLSQGVSTDLLPGEFYNGRYFPEGITVFDTAQKYASDKLQEAKTTAKNTYEKVKIFIDEVV